MKSLFKKIKKEKKMILFFFLVSIFVLFIIFYLIISNIQPVDNFAEEKEQAIINAGNFISPDLRGIDNSDLFIGEKDAKLSIIVYEDLSDYYSIEFNKTLNLILAEFKNDIVVAIRPYTSANSSISSSLNLFAFCAGKQNKFFEARDKILNLGENSFLFDENFAKSLEGLGLEEESFNSCMNSNDSLNELIALREEAENFNVFGVPTIFVNQEMIIGARSFENFVNSDGEEIEGMKNIIIRNLNK